jgi:hypothetical protein
VRSVHDNDRIGRDVGSSINKCDGVVHMQYIVHRAVNADIGGKRGSIGTLNGGRVVSVPNPGVVSARCHDAPAFCKTKKPHKRKGGHDGLSRGHMGCKGA